MKKKVVTITMNPSVDKTVALERFVPYGLNRVLSARTDPGGKGINVARALKNFGVDVTVSGLIAGKRGKWLSGCLKKSGLDIDFMETDGETRTNLKIVDKSVNRTTEINEKGFAVSADTLNGFENQYRRFLGNAAMIVLSGSMPPGVPDDFYAKYIAAAKRANVKTVLDADGAALIDGVKAVPYAVKPNIHELETLCGHTFSGIGEIVGAVRGLIETGIEIIIVSMGPDGAIVADRREIYKASPWTIKAGSEVGAGDAMVGALACSIFKNDSLFHLAKMATAAGTMTASKPGTQICTWEEVLAGMEKVTVEKLS